MAPILDAAPESKPLGEQNGFLRALLNAVPALLFVVDEDVRILECNAAASRLLDGKTNDALRRRAGDVLHCINAVDETGGCGRGPGCGDCLVRSAVRAAFADTETVRRRTKLEWRTATGAQQIFALISASSFHHAGRKLVLLVIEDISQLVELQKIIPICACCKRIRTDDKHSEDVEAYLKRNWDIDFSHGYCPECYEKQLAASRGAPAGP